MDPTGGSPPPWLDERLRGRLRYTPRLSRLVTSIDLFTAELEARGTRSATTAPPSSAGWTETAVRLLADARRAANERRLDDGWDFLHSAQRQVTTVLTKGEAAPLTISLERECAAKLIGWRRESAAANLAAITAVLREGPTGDTVAAARMAADRVPGGDDALAPASVRATLAHVQQLMDDNSHNAYLRVRLVGQRLVLATFLLAILLLALGALAAGEALDGTAFEHVSVLHHLGTYTTITMLGMLGALLSFSIGAMASGGGRRIYELASGRFAATSARVLVGAAAAVVVAIAVQSGVVGLNKEWLLILAVSAGFSERLVKRIIESLSADAEKPQEPPKAPEKPPEGQPGG